MVKKLLKIVTTLLVIALCIAGVFFYSIFVSVERLNIDYETISSTKIPSDLNDIKIGFISDLGYNHFMDKDRLTSMIATMNDAKPDVVIFGGDMFDLPLTYVPDDNTKQEVSQLLKTIQAPLGKFAVLGEQDNIDENTLSMVKDILYTSDFELLENTSIRIRNGSNESVTLVGLDSLIGGTIDTQQAFANVSPDNFNILAMHCPDTIAMDNFPTATVDLAFAGHSHSAQIYIPLLGSISSEEGAQNYNHGKYTINNTILHVSNGLGTTTLDMRLFSPPQMIVYRLKHVGIVKAEAEATPIEEVETPPEDTPTPETPE